MPASKALMPEQQRMQELEARIKCLEQEKNHIKKVMSDELGAVL